MSEAVVGRDRLPSPAGSRAPRADSVPTRLLIAEGQGLMRQALRRLVEEHPDVRVVSEASRSEELLEQLRSVQPDLALVAIELPGLSGLEVIRRAVAEGIDTRFIVVSAHEGLVHLKRAFEAGALGYVPKSADAAELLEAIDEVRAGNAFLATSLASVARALARMPDAAGRDRMEGLTPRERDVLALIGEGLSAREMATRLGVSPRTVEAYRSRLMAKLDVHRTAMLVRIAFEEGLLHP